MAPRFLKKLLQPQHGKGNQSPFPSNHNGFITQTADQSKTDRSLITIDKDENSNSQDLDGLWGNVYATFINSTESLGLKAVAVLLRDQTRVPKNARNPKSGDTSSPEWHVCEEVLQIAESQRSRLEDGSLGSRLRRAYEEIITWVEKFVTIGDMVAQIDPVHVGLPWAGVRAILKISLQDQKTRAATIENIAYISKLICRYEVFESVYLQDQSLLPQLVKSKLNMALKDLYMAVFQYLVETVSHLQSSTAARIGQSLIMSEKLTKLYAKIEEKEGEVLAYEKLSIRSASHAQYIDVRAKLCNYQDQLENQKRVEICEWISKIECYHHYQEMRSRVLDQTGRWFLESPEYGSWLKDNDSSLLWLRGDAGTGKTSLVSCVIETFLEKPWTDGQEAMAYFYCSRTTGDKRQQDPKSILLSVLRQLSAPMSGLPLKLPVIETYKKEYARGSKEANMSIAEITDILSKIIQEYYKDVTLIIDAIDECDVNKRLQLLSILTKLTYSPGTKVKTLISSRDDPDLKSHFSKVPNISITATNNANDIAKFVKHEIDERLLGGGARKALKDQVEKHLIEKSGGVFRWVALQVDTLCDSERVYREADVEYLLPKLPSTLKETYSMILSDLQRLPPESQQGVLNALKLISCTQNSMDQKQVIAVLTETSTSKQASSWSSDALLSMARGLIKLDEFWDVFVFAHLSVREFLEERPEFQTETTNAFTAGVCLRRYLDPSSELNNIMYGTIESYAIGNLGRHLMDAGNLRAQLPLSSLTEKFFTDPNTRAFDLWNRYCFRSTSSTLESPDPDCYTKLNDCISHPALPLFMICVYNLNELLDPVLSGYKHMLDVENISGCRPLEVAAQYGNHDALKHIHQAAIDNQPSSIRPEEWLSVAVQSENPQVWDYTIQHVSNVSFVKALSHAVKNVDHGKVIVSSLLKRVSSIDETDFCTILVNCASFELLEMVRMHAGLTNYTQSMLGSTVRNPYLNPTLVKTVLSENQGLQISVSCFYSLLRSSINEGDTWKTEVLKVLLQHPQRSAVSEEMIHVALSHVSTKSDIQCVDLLLQNCHLDDPAEDLLVAAITSSLLCDTNSFSWLLRHSTKPLLGRSALQCLLNKGLFLSSASERSMIWPDYPMDLQKHVTDMVADGLDLPLPISISKERLLNTVIDLRNGFVMTDWLMTELVSRITLKELKILLSVPRAFPISRGMIYAAAAENWGEDVFVQLIALREDVEFERSEDLLVAILSRDHGATDLLQILIERCGTLHFTENCVIAAVTDYGFRRGMTVVDFLISFCNVQMEQILTESALLAATKSSNLDFIEFFKLHRPEFRVSEELIEAALKEDTCNNAILKLFLSQPERCHITQSMVELAAQVREESVLQCIMEQPDAAIFAEVAKVILAEKQADTSVIEKVTQDLIVECFSGREILDDLDAGILDRLFSLYQGPALDTSHLLELAAKRSNGKFIIQELLQRFPNTRITNLALQEAAANTLALPSLLELLLDKTTGNGSKIDTSLLVTAAENACHGTQMIELLIAKSASYPTIDERLVTATLQNKSCGASILDIVLQIQPDLEITEDAINTAACNSVIGSILLQKLLKQALIRSSQKVVDIIFSRLESIENGLRDSLFMAVCYNEQSVFDLLLSRNVSLSVISGELGTALNIAVRVGNHDFVSKLLAKGCDIKSHSRMYGSPLETACHCLHIDIVRTLIEHGAISDKDDLTGLHRLHLALRENILNVAEVLISGGVSISAEDKQGMVALHHAALCMSSPDSLDYILKAGADADAEDSHGWTALHWAAKTGQTENVARLIKAGATRDKTDKSGRTPLDVAMHCSNFHLRSILALPGKVETTVSGVLWKRIVCDVCEMFIRGGRFKCQQCPDYDLCFRCIVDAKAIHGPDHEFLEI